MPNQTYYDLDKPVGTDLYIPKTEAERKEWLTTVDTAQGNFEWMSRGGTPGDREATMRMIDFDGMRGLADLWEGGGVRPWRRNRRGIAKPLAP